MNNNLYMSMIAFMDEDANYAGDEYLLEFCRIALCQNGYDGMNIAELRAAIQLLIPLDYTEEDIIRVIEKKPNSGIESQDEKYFLSSVATFDIQKREKNFALRKYIDDYCDKFISKDTSIDRNAFCDLVTRFIFEKFQESVEQIYSILDGTADIELKYADEYTDDECQFINDFLMWDNFEKNQMIYRLIVKSYDFCMINCPKSISFDFSSFRFYLDTNIIMRLLGINNSQRREVIERFVGKCKQVGINLYVSSFTKVEIEKSLDRQVEAISKEIDMMQRVQPPQTVAFGCPDSFSIDLYRQFYDYYSKRPGRTIAGFRTQILHELKQCLDSFNYDEEISFEVSNEEKYKGLTASLKQFKEEPVVKTDVNNVLLLIERRNQFKDSYMISADSKLIHWCKETFIGSNSLVEYPSVWLSIIMKYTGRATQDDYSAFCKFIRLPIATKDKDIKKKVDIKLSVEQMDVSDQMKDQIIDELNHNFTHYVEFRTPDEAAQKAHEQLMIEHDEAIRSEEREHYESEMAQMQAEHHRQVEAISSEKDSFEQSFVAARNEAEMATKYAAENSVTAKISKYVESKVKKRLQFSKQVEKHKHRIKLISTIMLVIAIVVTFSVRFIKFNTFSPSALEICIAAVAFVLEFIILGGVDATIERFGDEDELRNKFTSKANRKFKDLL